MKFLGFPSSSPDSRTIWLISRANGSDWKKTSSVGRTSKAAERQRVHRHSPKGVDFTMKRATAGHLLSDVDNLRNA